VGLGLDALGEQLDASDDRRIRATPKWSWPASETTAIRRAWRSPISAIE
jgi:hypothetical protein